jgi:hypothetical protein
MDDSGNRSSPAIAHLLTDEILVESTDEPVQGLLRPLFDQIWNGCGWQESINYDRGGR